MNISDYQYCFESITMRIILAFLLIFTSTATFSVNANPRLYNRALHDDLEDFLELVPKTEVLSILHEYSKHDKEVQSIVKYIHSSEFRKLVEVIESIPEVISLYRYVQESGLDVYYLVNKVHDIIELLSFPPLNEPAIKITGGVSGLIADVNHVVPINNIKTLYHEKTKTSVKFKKFLEHFQSSEFQVVVNKLFTNVKVKEIIKKAKAAGVDIKEITDLLSTIFGLEFFEDELIKISPGLHDDLEDFVALIPGDEISSIFREYVTHDKEVQYVIEYIQTSEFRELVKAIESIPDVVTFYKYLQESGLDIYYLINKLHEFIGLPPIVPLIAPVQITGGISGLIADIKIILPIHDIKALYVEKLETSVEFKKLIERLQSPAFQAVIDTLLANSEFQKIVEKAKAIGIDIKAITDLLSTIFGLEFPEHELIKTLPGLHEDFEDFLTLIPVNEISKFQKIVEKAKAIGIDIKAITDLLFTIFGLEFPGNLRTLSHTSYFGFGELRSVFSLAKVNEVFKPYLNVNDEVKKSIQHFRTKRFMNIINTINRLSTVHYSNQDLDEFSHDIYQLVNVLRRILDISDAKSGIIPNKMTFASQVTDRSLKDDVHDFISLIPMDKVLKVTVKYIINDDEVKAAIEYIESQELEDLVVKLQNDPEVYELLRYFVDSGADIISVINILNEFLGFPPYQFPEKINRDNAITDGVQGMLNEIRMILPYDKIEIMYNKKLRESQEFRYFIERIKDQAFQKIIDKIVVNSNVLELGYQAELHGINLDTIVKFLSEVFGLNLPDPPYFPSTTTIYHKRARSLSDDFTDFYDLLPIEDIVELAVQYVLEDKEMQEVLAYFHSQNFKNIIDTLHGIPEYEQILTKLREQGIDVDSIISILQEIISFGDVYSSSFPERVEKPGLTGFIGSVKKLLPYEQIKALYEKKLKTSKAFAEFVALISSEQFQTLTNKLFANDDFKSLLKEAKEYGVDLLAISDFFLQVFGIETPPGIINYDY
ncbi:hypothetical protein PV327_002935 [Microctonus hyperodae]|uniref:Protein G12 n=1 Tax=Microctonus hyperodae TaxID=165561 RepID=A0AA39L0M0_MICHY|nr:hypothetical protein PV327_002935 [Microctonus hyperodae]